MISLGSRDGRKGIELGSGGGREMKEIELEEGEACSYQEDEECRILDPDVALSYIDKKLQNVLGHFQKDFEGGVSAENLGSKFGGYGSFLPTYQRSPGCTQTTHPKTPPKTQTYNTFGRAKSSQPESGHQSSLISTSAHLVKHRPTVTPPVTTAPALNHSSKWDVGLGQVEESNTANRSGNLPEQTHLRFRIKVGSDNLSTQNNAAIYSGLGLDVSPSSSIEESPTESEGLSRVPQDASDESPSIILQNMTSFPVHGDSLLSPLREDLFHLTKKEKPLRDNKCGPIPEAVRENFVALVNGPDPLLSEWKFLGQKKTRPAEKNSTLLELKNINGKDFMKSNVFSAIDKEEPFDIYPRQDGSKKGEKRNDVLKVDLNASKGMKATNTDASSHLKMKPDKKATSNEHIVMTLFAGSEKSSSVGKKKAKGSITHYPLPEEPKEAIKSTPAENLISKSESEHLKLQKNCGKASDKYRDFFGDFLLEQEENEVDPMEVPSAGRVKISKVIGKNRFTSHNGTEEKLGGKQIKQSLTAESLLNDDSYIAALDVNGPVLNAVPPRAALTENNDDWVCCDKCEKWRLLPIGTNPESLPEKWLCSMLDWVSGMNRCSVSEDETTNAAISLNQALTSQNQINLHAVSLHPFPSKDKTKYEPMEILDTVNQEHPAQVPGFKKILQPSVMSISLSEANQSPRVKELDCQQLQNSSDSAVEKSRSKKKDMQKSHETYSDGGTAKNPKMKIKRENELDNGGAFKKIKKEGMQYTTSSNGVPTDIAVKNQSNYSDRSCSRDSRGEVKEKMKVSIKNMRNPVQISLEDRSFNKNQNGSIDIFAKKRKVKEESSENSQRNEKKARAQKYEGEDFIINEGSKKRSDKRVGTIMDQQVSQHSCDDIDYFTRDLGSSQPAAAATSSSSKISGSHKSKSKFQETKDSPVESVSSSPLRTSNMDRLAAGRLNHVEKDDLRDDVNIANKGSPRRYSVGEDNGGSNRLGSMKKDKSVIIPQHGSHESSVLDFQELDIGHFSHSRTNAQVTSPEVTNGHVLNGSADIIGQYSKKSQSPVRCCVEERRNDYHNRASGSHSKTSGKGPSAKSKDNINCSQSHVKHQNSNSMISFQDKPVAYEEKKKDKKNRFQEKCRVDSLKDAKKNAYKRHSEVKLSGESSKRDSHLKHEGNGGPQFKVDGTNKQNLTRDRDGDKSPKVSLPEKTDRTEIITSKGRSVPLPLSRRGQAPVSFKENETGISSIAASECENEFKGPKHYRKVESENRCEQINSRHDTPNGQRVRDLNSRSPVKKDSISQAANNALKEAKDLKHLADRLKNPGSNHEKSALYFEAALKFLYGASLLESCSGENSKHGDQAMLIFSSTAKFCRFCAQEYERSKDMAAAALAYKCMEVAYMRVIYSSRSNASRDRHELHTALQITLPGESPSSSASDVDNLNNVATVDKVSIAKCVYSPEVPGSHVIPSPNRPSYVRLLNYVQDVNNAMEASRKSRIAFEAASVSLEGTQNKVIISSIKRALDFTFQDVEGLLHLVRVAMDTIGR